MGFTIQEVQALNIIVKISAVLGISGFCMLLHQFIHYRHEFQSAMGKIVVMLAIGDLMDSCVKAIGPIGYSWGTETALCQFQGSAILFANNSSIFNSLTIGIWAVYLTFFSGDVRYILKYQYLFIFANFSIALTFSLLASLLPPSMYQSSVHMIGDADLWCFITSQFVSFQLYLQFLWVFTITVLNTIFIVLAWNYSRSNQTLSKSKQLGSFITRLIYYLTAFLIVWTPITLNRMVTATTGKSFFILAVIQAMVSPSRGFFYSLAFLFSKQKVAQSTFGTVFASQEKDLPPNYNFPPVRDVVDPYENIFEIDQYLNA